MTPTLELRSLRKAYRDTVAVDGVSFAVPPGTVFGLLGPNGAGKSTTLRMVMDIIAPDQGEVLFAGRPRSRADLERIGYLPEERGLYRRMTVIDHLGFLGELNGVPRREGTARARRWLERLELADAAEKKVEELSKGMQQKVQIAATLLHEPELLILDEPFSGLDPMNQVLFKDLLAEYKRQGRTIILSTHVMEQAEKLCDHICLIARGRSVLAGELGAIKREMGGNSFRLVAAGDLGRIAALPGVLEVLRGEGGDGAGDGRSGDGRSGDRTARVLLEPGADRAALLRELVAFLDVHEFVGAEPDLGEIFVRAVRDAA